ncbi:hypothetical protein ES703_102610 [subsurface metagenome]
MSGKGRSTQANDARLFNDLSYLIGMESEVVIIMFDTRVMFIPSIRFNGNCQTGWA